MRKIIKQKCKSCNIRFYTFLYNKQELDSCVRCYFEEFEKKNGEKYGK